MTALGLSPFGLLLATAMSVTNVFTDVARKHALERRDLVPATFWIRVAVAAVFVLVLAWRVVGGAAIEIRDTGPLFGLALLTLPTLPTFFVYLVMDVSLITIVMWLYFRALQISPMSLCVPFLSFTPVFLIFTTFVLLGEKIAPLKSLACISHHG